MFIDFFALKSNPDFSDWGIKQVLESEIKRKCFSCKQTQSVRNIACVSCFSSPNLTDNFEQKEPDELDKLFVGAPVMYKQIHVEEATWLLGVYEENNIDPFIWLPTVAEAPRNVWLAPWLEMPDELNGKQILLRFDDNHIEDSHPAKYCRDIWKNVTAIMIFGDLE